MNKYLVNLYKSALFLILCLFVIIVSWCANTSSTTSDCNEKIIYNTVIATMYNAKKSQTDSTPHITADGTRINVNWAGKYRYIAVSRDLLEINGGYLNYGDYIVVQGINGKYDGIWQVKDTMNKRWNNRVDLLCNPNERPFKKNNVIIKYYL